MAVMLSAAQTNQSCHTPSIVISSLRNSARTSSDIIREIDDPATGDNWLLERDEQHPGGPGRLVLIAHEGKSFAPVKDPVEPGRESSDFGTLPALIHSGDHLTVEEHTNVADVVLEATAMSPARRGETFSVRLSFGGHVMNAIAVAPGHALLTTDFGLRP